MIKIFPVLFMKPLMLFVLLFCGLIISGQHILIHSHNDYQQAEPLINALRNKVYSIEADIYLVNDTLKVAHDKRELPTAPSLSDLYIQPIVKLFKLNQGHISSDHHYAPVLMIDIKDNGEAALTALTKMLSQYPSVFDRLVNISS